MRRIAISLALFAALFWAVPASAETPDVARLLPNTTVFFAEIAEPAKLVDAVADHPLVAKVQQTQGYRDVTATPQYLVGQFILGSIEAKLDQKWRPALKSAFGGGIAAGFDAKTQGAVVIARAQDPQALKKLVSTLIQLARDDAKRKDKPDPVREDTYRDVTVYRLDKGAFAIHDGTLVVTNNGDLGKFVLDRLLDGGGETLAINGAFQKACDTRTSDSTAWVYLDMEPVRTMAGEKSPLATGRTENFLAELLIGGAIDTARKTPFVTGSITLSDDDLSLTLAAPHEAAWQTEARRYYFGDGGGAPPALHLENTLFTLGAFRDVSEMWLRAGDLLDQKGADQLAQAESVLTTLFSGKDFGEDVLGALKPDVQLILARQEFAEGQPTPAVRLPAFALIGTFKDPDAMRTEFRRTFLSLIGFVNVTGAMEGRPQFDFEVSQEGDDQVVTTRYVVEKNRIKEEQAPIYFNFSPSLAFVDDRIVIASTEAIARQLVVAMRKPAPAAAEARPNTVVELAVPVLHQVLVDNREQLIAQNMLSKGHDRKEAEREIDGLLTLAGLLRDAKLTLDRTGDRLQLRLDLGWTE
jgi:hypothetical protein